MGRQLKLVDIAAHSEHHNRGHCWAANGGCLRMNGTNWDVVRLLEILGDCYGAAENMMHLPLVDESRVADPSGKLGFDVMVSE